MPITYRIDKDLQVVFSQGEGVVTVQEMKVYFQTLGQDSGFTSTFSELADTSGITELDPTIPEWRNVADEDSVFGKESRRAIVIPDYPRLYGLVRMYQTFREDRPDKLQIFESVKEAREWLGLGDDE